MAEFELHIGNMNAARAVYERANRALANGDKEERLILLESWLKFEQEHGDATNVDKVGYIFIVGS